MMKKLIILIAITASVSACSNCYECTEEVVQYNGNTAVDTITNSEELCTADQAEIDDRESDGATCQSI